MSRAADTVRDELSRLFAQRMEGDEGPFSTVTTAMAEVLAEIATDHVAALLDAAPDREADAWHVPLAEIDAQREKGWVDFHPEHFCHRCGNHNLSWFTVADVWNPVMRPDGNDSPWRWNEIICPSCFAELAGGWPSEGGNSWALVPRRDYDALLAGTNTAEPDAALRKRIEAVCDEAETTKDYAGNTAWVNAALIRAALAEGGSE